MDPLDHFCTRGQDLALANGNRLFVQFNAIKFDGRIEVGDLPKIATHVAPEFQNRSGRELDYLLS